MESKILYLSEAGPLADCYESCHTGGFKLTARAKAQLKAEALELEATRAEHSEILATRTAELERVKGQLDKKLKSGALADALYRARVDRRLSSAATALLLDKLNLEVVQEDDIYTVEARGEFGRMTADEAVRQWLASPDGDAFKPQPVSGSGRFVTAVRKLK